VTQETTRLHLHFVDVGCPRLSFMSICAAGFAVTARAVCASFPHG
jgi:hypothetical protein